MIATINGDTKINGKGHPTEVRIPDMFGSIMSATPMVNPHHFKVKAAADAFIADYLKMDKHEAAKNRKADFCFCASAMAPHADAEALRTMVDWLNWIFYFDDDFDEGQLDRDPVAAEKEIRHTLAVLEDGSEIPDREQYPLRYLIRTIWDRVKERAYPDVQKQFKITHKRYLDGLLHQVEATRDGNGQPRTEEDYIRMRRRTVGGYPCISLIAYAHNVNLSHEAFEHPSVQECIAVGCDLAWIHNDIVSYKKDVKSGIEHNFVTVLKKNGFTTQQAMDRAGELQDECYRRWYLALASMPIWAQKDSSKLEVAIAGGGIAGLITAIALLKHPNVNVQVYERAPEFKEIGASIALGPNGLRTLDRLGVENALAEGFAQRQKSGYPMIYRHWKTGEVIDYDVHSIVQSKKHATARFHRAHLHQALLENLPEGIVHLGKTTVDVKADPDEGATLYFEDGTTATADIVIGADGLRSKVRKTFVPEHELHWTGWVAFRAVFDADRLKNLEYPEDAAHWAGHETTFFHSHLGKGLFTIVGGYHADPKDPKSPGKDAKWDEDGSVEEFKRLYQHWNPTIRAFIDATPYVKLFPNYAGAALDTWFFSNRVALVGDAAHTHGGSFAAGGSLAIDDAYALYRSLDYIWPPSAAQRGKPTKAQLAQVFELYEATRKPHLDKLLGIVHKNISGQKSNIERATTERDEQLRQRVKGRMNPSWISEHDVVAAFERAVERVEGREKTVEEPRARL
ncbi:salicylate 1-monooxygenase [Fusarium phyllophilum]|uniref:Salicylate 1-monooxygenase n=1 Tax=Fusarium phyllophilum TaxID=47803 RepID=A0A8H5JY25_9HYPO|nr:salicylate 1-monooxygenase [Fusarium phyllophilum]